MLKKEDILKIPKMRETMSPVDIAKHFDVNVSTIVRWMKRLREAGHDVPKAKGGVKKIEL